MERISGENEEIIRLFIIAAAFIGAILSTVFSLTHAIFDVYPFLYILPIILCVYFYPRRAVLFSLLISLTYIGIIYILGYSDPKMVVISTAWFAIFIVIGVVASSYANRLLEEKMKIHDILANTQDGIICFNPGTRKIREINAKCAGWLHYDKNDLAGKDISFIWPDSQDRRRFFADVERRQPNPETETFFRAQDGTLLRFIISAVLVNRDYVLCSAMDITCNQKADDEIRKTLEDLEEQVKARTARLEKINTELRAEILERRHSENRMVPDIHKRREEWK